MCASFRQTISATTASIGLSVGAVALLAMTAIPVLAQMPASANPATGTRLGHQTGVGESLPRSSHASNVGHADTRSTIAPTLPASAIGDDGASHDYLRAARVSLVGGRTGQAQQSLEMAETRALDRWVPAGQTAVASDSQFVSWIRNARHAVAGGDSARHSIHRPRFVELRPRIRCAAMDIEGRRNRFYRSIKRTRPTRSPLVSRPRCGGSCGEKAVLAGGCRASSGGLRHSLGFPEGFAVSPSPNHLTRRVVAATVWVKNVSKDLPSGRGTRSALKGSSEESGTRAE